jgi:hypothetical protein
MLFIDGGCPLNQDAVSGFRVRVQREMAEYKMTMSGWQAAIIAVVLIGVVVLRLTTISDMRGDDGLMQHIHSLMMDEYSPYMADKLREVYNSERQDKKKQSVESVLSTEMKIISVQASYPVFKFSIPKDVVIKVVYSLEEADTIGEERTIFYLFKYGAFGWQYQHISTSFRYYLNFI